MSYMFEVYYRSPRDLDREERLAVRIGQFGGRLDFREEPGQSGVAAICLTYEFSDLEQATLAANELRRVGEHVEGPVCYAE